MFSCRMLLDEPASAVLDLYANDLANVQFPDVSLTILEQADRAVKDALAELAQAEALLESAHATLLARQEELAQKATRALAYARIYAESDEALAEKVAAISALPGLSPRSARRPPEATPGQSLAAAPRRRGRPPKTQPEQTALGAGPSPDEPANPDVVAAE